MATAKMYAWTNIKTADGVVKAGEAVTASSLGVGEDEWAQLLDSKVVREAKFPDMPADYTGSPLEFIQEDLRKQLAAAEDALSEDDALLEATQEAEGTVE